MKHTREKKPSVVREVANVLMRRAGYVKAAGYPGIVTGRVITDESPEAYDLVSNAYAYAVHNVIYACVFAIASSGSGLPVKLLQRERGVDPGDWQQVFDHPVLDLLAEPNKWNTGIDLMEATLSDLELTGDVFWYVVEDGAGVPREIHRLRPDWMEVVPHPKKFIEGYLLKKGGESVPFTPDEIMHHKTFNPLSVFRGQSSISAARMAAGLDVQAQIYGKSFFKNSARPDGVLETDEDLDDDAYEVLREDWKKAHQGPDKAHRIAILTNGLTYHAVQISPKDIDFVVLRQMSREDVAMCFRVPPAMIGLLDESNYSNMMAQKASFWHETMIPKLRKLELWVTRNLARRFDPDLVVKFDLSGVYALILNEKEMSAVDAELIRVGMYTANQRRRIRGVGPDLPWGDVWWTNLSMVPVTGAKAPAEDLLGGGSAPQRERSEQPGPGGRGGGAPKRTLESGDTYEIPTRWKTWGSDLPDPLQKIARKTRWLQWQAMTMPIQAQFAGRCNAVWNDQKGIVLDNMRADTRSADEILIAVQKRVAAAAEDGLDPDTPAWFKYILADIESWLFDYDYGVDGTVKACRPTLIHGVSSGAKFVIDELDLDMMFDPQIPRVARAVESNAFKFAQEVTDTTLADLRATLGEGVLDGDSKRQLTGRVQDAFKGRKDNAPTVAQTEVGSITNKGAVEAYVQSGVVEAKQWHDGGPRTREHHVTAGGIFASSGAPAIVPVTADYIVMGEAMEHPGDKRGSPKNVCNCHCGSLPVLGD